MAIDTAALRALLAAVGATQGTRIQVADSLENIADILDTLADGTADLIADTVTVTDDAYNATDWNGDLSVPTKNAVRDELETIKTAYLGKVAFYANVASAVSTTSASYAVLSSASITLTVASGEAVVLYATCSMSTSLADGTIASFRLSQNSVDIGEQVQAVDSVTTSASGNVRSVSVATILTIPTVGTNTYSLRFARASGSGTVYGRFPQLIGFTIKTS